MMMSTSVGRDGLAGDEVVRLSNNFLVMSKPFVIQHERERRTPIVYAESDCWLDL